MDVAFLREALKSWQGPALETQFILFVVLTAASLHGLLQRVPGRAAVAAVVAAIAAIGIGTSSVPQTSRIFYDEQIYQGVAQNLSDLGLAQMCNEGTVEYGRLQCRQGEYIKQTYGYPYVVSLLYRLLGVHAWIAPAVNTFAMGAFVLAVFLVSGLAFHDWRAAAFAAMAAAMLPEHLKWSRTAAAEPTAALMVMVGLLSALWFVRSRTFIALAWMVVTVVFALQFKIESVLLVPLVGAVVLVGARDAYRQRWFWLVVLAGVLLGSVYLAHLYAVRNESWGASGNRMSMEFAWSNAVTNARYYFDNSRFPLIVSLLGVAGAVHRPNRDSAIVVAGFALFWGVYVGFYAGSYEYGADVRYALMSHGPVAILAGRGASALCSMIHGLVGASRRVDIGVAAVLAFECLSFMPAIRDVGEEAWAARADVAFADQMSTRLGPHAIVLTHNPSIFHLRGVNAAQLGLALVDTPYVASLLPSRYAGGVFVHWNFWCNALETPHAASCSQVLERFNHQLVSEYRERDQRFAFYRLSPGEAAAPGAPLRLLTRDP